jgi:hypothetical protein
VKCATLNSSCLSWADEAALATVCAARRVVEHELPDWGAELTTGINFPNASEADVAVRIATEGIHASSSIGAAGVCRP